MESLYKLAGAPPSKQFKNVPISTSLFFSGLYTQRSPFGSPDSRYYSKFLGGRTDILIDGANTELTNYGTLIRRPGTIPYSTANLGSTPLTFYSFHQLGNTINPIQIIADTVSTVYSLTTTSKTTILNKSNGAGQSYFQGIGSTLYIADGVDLQAWTGSGSTRNWGIAMVNTADTTGPNGCGSGANIAFNGNAWSNPGNITANDGSFATITLNPGTGGSFTSGPNGFGLQSFGGDWIAIGGGVLKWTNSGGSGTTSLILNTNYGFNIPLTASILGITAVVTVENDNGGGVTGDAADATVELLKGGVAVGSNKAVGAFLPMNAVLTYGGSSDLWGTTWTPADINGSGFGMEVNFAFINFTAFIRVSTITITITYSVPAGTTFTDYLEGTNFGFGLSSANTISGVLVEVKGLGNLQPAGATVSVQILKNGVLAGVAKTGQTLPGSNSFMSFGGNSDLWGTTFSPGDTNSSGFGLAIQGVNSGSSNGQWSVDFIRITIFGTGGPSVSTTGSGSFTVFSGVQYIYAYSNSQSGQVSNPTPPSANTGPFGGVIASSVLAAAGTGYAINDTGIVSAGAFNAKYQVLTVSGGNVLTYSITAAGTGYSIANNVQTFRSGAQPGAGVGFSINITGVTGVASVQVSVTASPDPQVDGIRVFRTTDNGSTFFELPTSPYPNTTTTITDSAPDSQLNKFSSFSFSPWLANSTPPAGMTRMTYHLNRMWGVVNNNVYFSALLGDDITVGVGVESWPPVNVFVFPETVNRLMPIVSGLLVFTTDDIWIITGTSRDGTTGALLTSQIFQQGVGLLSWNAFDVEGNQIFLYTSDRQFISFTASGPVEIGYPIGVNIQSNYNPAQVYVAALISGTQDKAVFLADGTSNWYRCNWNQPPEGGPAWSPQASINGGATAVVAVETSPGIHQLLIGQSNGTVLARNYNVFSDNAVPYASFATIGSLVLAQPGQLAVLNSVVLELQQVGSIPNVSLLLDEISGTFEQLTQSVTDPPKLIPSQTVMSRRWYLSQGNESYMCRHIQLKVSWPAESFKNELLTLTEIGALINEE